MGSINQNSNTTVKPLISLMVGWATMFVVGSDLFVVSPLLPAIMADYAISPAAAGLSVTVFAFAYVVSAPLLGHIADRIGRSRVMIFCLCAFGLANLLTAAAANLTWLLVTRSMAGAMAAGVSPSLYALISSSAPPGRRATWLAIPVSGLLMALMFGAPMGLLTGAAFGWPVVFAGLGGLSVLLAATNSWVWRDCHGAALPNVAPGRLKRSAVAIRLARTVAWSAAVYAIYIYLGEGLALIGHSTQEIAKVIVCYGWGAIAGVLIGGRMADRFGAKLTSELALGGLCFCFLLLRIALDAGVLVNLAFALCSLAAQLFFPAQQVRLADEFPASRATVLAWNNSALFLGISLGSIIGGLAISAAGLEFDLQVAATLAMFGCVICKLGARPRRALSDHATAPTGGDTTGRETVTVVPDPSSLSMASVPPWSSTTDFAKGSPSPAP